jgi:hypothetical protein
MKGALNAYAKNQRLFQAVGRETFGPRPGGGEVACVYFVS